MPVTITNTLVSVADGAGAPVNIASGGVATVTPGNILTFALQSTSIVQSWTLQFICPAYPSLNGRIYNWYQGQANQLLVPLPGESVSSTDPARGIQWVSSVTDGASVASSQGYIAASIGGGVSSLIAGTNITLSPTTGLGAVTVNATGGSTPGGDLQTSTSTLQWVSSISAADGDNGDVGINATFRTQRDTPFVWTQQTQAAGVAPNQWTVSAQPPSPLATNAVDGSPGFVVLDTGVPIAFTGFFQPLQIKAGPNFAALIGNFGASYTTTSYIGLGFGCTPSNIFSNWCLSSPGSGFVQLNAPGAGAFAQILNNSVPSAMFYINGPGFGGMGSGARIPGTAAYGGGTGCIALNTADTEPNADPTSTGGCYVLWGSDSTLSLRVRTANRVNVGLVPACTDPIGALSNQITVNPFVTTLSTANTTPTAFARLVPSVVTGSVYAIEYRLVGHKRNGGAGAFAEGGRIVAEYNSPSIAFASLSTGTLGLGGGQVGYTTSTTGAPMVTAADAGSGNVQFSVKAPDNNTNDWTLYVWQWVM
jgi:hypothetical protein